MIFAVRKLPVDYHETAYMLLQINKQLMFSLLWFCGVIFAAGGRHLALGTRGFYRPTRVFLIVVN